MRLVNGEGKVVQSIYNQTYFPAGEHRNSITFNEFPTGVYYLVLKTEGINPMQWTKKVMII